MVKNKSTEEDFQKTKHNIVISCNYFRDNEIRWHTFKGMACDTTLTSADLALYAQINMPAVEFNIGAAYLARLIGEFSKYEPGVILRALNQKVNPQLITLLEGHIMAILQDTRQNNFQYHLYKDILYGGYSVAHAYTDYENQMSADLMVCNTHLYDPTLAGFDPLAKLPHKGDGRWAFERFIKTEEEMIKEFGSDSIKNTKFGSPLGGTSLQWSYKNLDERLWTVVNYYFKEKVEKEIVKLVNGESMTTDEYEKQKNLHEKIGAYEIFPYAVGKPIKKEIDVIVHQYVTGNKIEHEEKTNLLYLPYVFMDGNSELLRENGNGDLQQMTKPYIYHLQGVQKFKNYAGALLLSGLENTVRHKLMAPVKGIPAESREAYQDVQKASLLPYHSHDPDNPEIALPSPSAVPQTQMPDQVMALFEMISRTGQEIVGNFDADLARLTKGQMSGIAIQEAMTLSNSAAQPYLASYLECFTQLIRVDISLMSEIYKDSRVIPVYSKKKGAVENARINYPDSIKFKFDPMSLHVQMEAGANFQLQKTQAFTQIQELMRDSPIFQQFINTKGLKWLLDNIDIRGIEELKQEAEMFMQQMDSMHQQQMKQQSQIPNPAVVKAQLDQAKLQQDSQKNMIDSRLKAAEISIKKQEADTNQLKVFSDVGIQINQAEVQKDKVDAQNARSAVDLAISTARLHEELHDSSHRRDKEAIELLQKHLDMEHKHNKERNNESNNNVV